jgi:hypothetical protein
MKFDEALAIIRTFGKVVETASSNNRKELEEMKSRLLSHPKKMHEALSSARYLPEELLPFSRDEIKEAAQVLIDSGEFKNENLNVEWLLDSFK